MSRSSIIFIGTLALLSGCSDDSDGWTTLFNGENLDGWHVYNRGKDFNGWKVEDGAIVYDPRGRKDPGRTDLITDGQYTDFELSLEWKIGEYGNSGLFWAVVEDPQYEHSYTTGIEIQILDDNWTDYIEQNGDLTRAGALYGLQAPTAVVSKTGPDEWNHFLLHIGYSNNEGWLIFNDQEVLRFPVSGPEWDTLVANSRFADNPTFGLSQTGHIVLQEYGGTVSFRNVRIRELR